MRAAVLLSLAAASFPGLSSAQGAQAGIDAARRGGVVAVCRHAITDQSRDDADVIDYGDVRTQRLLSDEGERQARALGDAFRQLEIVATDVIASPMDRAWRTADLMFGRTTIDSLWHTADNNYGGERRDRRRRIVATPITSGVRFIVSHIVTIASAVPEAEGELQEGDCIIVRPTGTGYEVQGVVPWREWIRAAADARSP